MALANAQQKQNDVSNWYDVAVTRCTIDDSRLNDAIEYGKN